VSDTDSPNDSEPAAQADEPTVEASTVPAEPEVAEPTPAPTVAEPVTSETAAVPAATVPAAPPPERRGGILLPTWVAVVLAILLIGGIGVAVGYWTGDGDDDSNASNAANSQTIPNGQGPLGNARPLPNGNGNNGNGNNGNGNGQTIADTAFLGVSVEAVGDNGGARVTSVRPGSPAADAGLKTGDVITKVGDTDIQSDADLIRAIRSHDPGDDVTITYTRDGNSAQAKVELANRSDAARNSVPS
jgi:membrane-associated protease RseP (regulator of RpoE activity)